VATPEGAEYKGQPHRQGIGSPASDLLSGAEGTPLMFCVTGANRHDSVVFEEVADASPAVRGKPSKSRSWPGKIHADKGYDAAPRCSSQRRGIQDRVVRKGIERNDWFGRYRRVVERTHS
jgi:hypothetical protein